jgi:hypothetical protein
VNRQGANVTIKTLENETKNEAFYGVKCSLHWFLKKKIKGFSDLGIGLRASVIRLWEI